MEKIALITGGNSGIGREAAVQLALQGFIVIIACRNENKGKIALDYIKNKSKSDKINLVKLDLSLNVGL